MDLSAVQIEEVQNVLHAMQKILECPICLELIKEPISTKCDHIFCKFCMLKLLNQKKGPSQCPLCKNEITKRSLQGSTRFSQLVEELLKITDAFELDTGIQFTNSCSFSKTKNSSEPLNEEASVIQSVGYRNRVKTLGQIESGDATVKDSVGVQLSNLGIVKSTKKNQTWLRNKSVYIELGSDSSEEIVNEPDGCSARDQELLQISPRGAGDEASLDSAKKAACEFSEDITDIEQLQCHNKDLNPIENHATERHPEKCQGISISNLHVEPCGTDIHASSLQPENSSLLLTEDRVNVEKAEFYNKGKQSDLARSQRNRWAESKETCNNRQIPSTEKKVDLNTESFCGRKKSNNQKSLCPENSGATQDVPWITLNSSIQKVNEWFSKTGEMLTSDGASDRRLGSPAEAAVKENGCSSSSKETDSVAAHPHSSLMDESKRDCKPVEKNIKDKIFGKTYQRKGSFPHLNHVAEIISTFTIEPQTTQEHSFTNKLKRKRRTTCLHPEDFIKKADLTVIQKTPENRNQGVDQIEPNGQVMGFNSTDQENETNGNSLQKKKNVNPIASVGKEPVFTTKAKPVSSGTSHLEPELSVHSSKAPKKSRLKRKPSTRCVLALEPVSGNPSPPNCTELQIDSCSSSEETKEKDSTVTPVKDTRKPQLTEDTGPGAGAKNSGPREQIRKRRASDAFPEEMFPNIPGLLTNCPSSNRPQGPVSPSPQRKEAEKLETCQMSGGTKDLKDLVLGGEQGLSTERSEESTSVSLVADTEYDTQNSVSLLEANPVRYAKTGSSQCMTQFVASENPKDLAHGSNDAGSSTECVKHQLRQELGHIQEAVEIEEGELDTQYLQKTFQVSNRQTFTLFSKPGDSQKECIAACASSVSLREVSPKVTSTGEREEVIRGQEESEISCGQVVSATMGLPLLHQEGKPGSDRMCAGVSRLCSSSQYGRNPSSTGDLGIPQNSHLKQSVSPITSSVKTDQGKTLSEGQFEKHTLSAEKAMGNGSAVQSTVYTLSQNNRKNACREANLGSINEVYSSGENVQGQLGRKTETKLNAVLSLGLTKPEVCKQSFPVSDYKYLEMKKQEGEAVGADFSSCLFSDKLKQPMGSGNIFQVCSETPDDLLDDVEIQGITSFGEDDIMEKSAVFNGSVQRREFSRSPSPLTHGSLAHSLHRRSRKLESSEESECCEDEDLPSFQHFLGRVSNVPERTRHSSTVTQRLSEKAEETQAPWKCSIGDSDNEVILIEASQEHHLSEDAKCSGSMFSSQHSAADAGSRGPVFSFPSKQVSHQSEKEEVFLSDKELISDDEEMGTCLEEDNDEEEDILIPDSAEAASGYESETNFSEDCSQSDILTTQQRATIKDNLIKLQQEMAHLEAVLEGQGNQPSGHSSFLIADPCTPEELPNLEQNKSGTALLTSKNINENPISRNPTCVSADKFQPQPPDSSISGNKESGMGRPLKSPLAASRCSTHSRSGSLQNRNYPSQEERLRVLEAEESCELHNLAEPSCLPKQDLEGTPYLESGISLFSNRDSESESPKEASHVCTIPASISARKISQCQVAFKSPAAAHAHTAVVETVSQIKPELTSSKGRANTAISMVVSGLTLKEVMVVQKFAEKYHLTLTDVITEETTHVIIKTDAELVCERTLKYFLGIAGGKWIVSYSWVTRSIQERRLLSEHEFEVKGDVVTGRNHQGPKRSRESQEKLFKGLKICCCEPFTNMPKDELERMLQLCGASVVKELSSLTHDTMQGVYPVVIVQPSAWTEESGCPAWSHYVALAGLEPAMSWNSMSSTCLCLPTSGIKEIGQLCKAHLVMWDWVLDSISVYQCRDLDAYLVQNITHGHDYSEPQDPND